MAAIQLQVTLVCGRVVGNTSTADNIREDVLRVLDRLHLLWCLDNSVYGNLFRDVSGLRSGEKVTTPGILNQIAEALAHANAGVIAAAPARRFVNKRINKSVGLLETQKDAENEKRDVLLLQDGMVEWGLLAQKDADTEQKDIEKSGITGSVPSALFPKTRDAMTKLKIEIVRGAWGWAPIRADEVSDDGDRYGLQTYPCDSYSVFLPGATNAARPKSDVHIFFSPAGVWGSRFCEPLSDTFKEPSQKGRPALPVNEVLVHGLRGAFDSSNWVLIGVPGRVPDTTITLTDIQNCLDRGGQSREIGRIRLSAYSGGHVGLSHTINLPLKEFPREKVERIYILDAEYESLTDAINKSGISHSKVTLYQVTVESPKNRLSAAAERRKIDKRAVLGLGYTRAIEDARITKPDIRKLLTSKVEEQLPGRLLARGKYTFSGINQFGRDNAATIGKMLTRNAVRAPENVKDFVGKNDCLWYGAPFVEVSDAHHFFVCEIAHELVE